MIPEMVHEVIALHTMHKLCDRNQRALGVIDFLYFARNHWRPEVIDQRAANRKTWFDTKFPERKLSEVVS